MSRLQKKRHQFRPTLVHATLEERQVLSTRAIPATPPPAPPPVSALAVAMEKGEVRTAYVKQVQAATVALRNAVKADNSQLYSNGSDPTSQQMTDFAAEVAGAVNATALRISSQAALLPNASASLVPKIQNSLLGSGSNSLTSRLTALALTSGTTGSAMNLQSAMINQINRISTQTTAEVNNYFSTTPLNRLSTSSSGQRIPLEEYMAREVLGQTANNFGSLAASFPAVASAMFYPTGTTTTTLTEVVTPTTPSQELVDEFGVSATNALSTAAYELTSDLALFPHSSTVTPAIQAALFGSSATSTSLSSAIASLPYGSTTFNSAVATAFNSAYQNVITPVMSFLQTTTQTDAGLPTTGLTSPYITGYDTGFNNGFATGSAPVSSVSASRRPRSTRRTERALRPTCSIRT